MRPTGLGEIVGQKHLLGRRFAAQPGHLGRPRSVDDPLGPPRKRENDARAGDRVGYAVGLRELQRGHGQRGRAPRDRGGGARSSRLPRASGRSSSSTRSTASTRRSRTRSCPTSRKGRSSSSGPRRRTPASPSTQRSCRAARSSASRRSRTGDLVALLKRALTDPARGLGAKGLAADDDALRAIAGMAGGDARRALSTLEVVADWLETREPTGGQRVSTRRGEGRRGPPASALRQGRRGALQRRQRVHQVDARKRPRRRHLLDDAHARGR